MSAELPWRGPGPGRPELALPPGRMPLRRGGSWRKRWRYVGFFGDEILGCAARVSVGPLGQTFWALYDRREGRLLEQTRPRLPGRRGEVWTEDLSGRALEQAPERGSVLRIAGRDRDAGEVGATLRLGGGRWVESVCPAAGRGYVWTRKRAGAALAGELTIGGERRAVEALAVEDESAGYHPRHTVWSWSAGVGTAVDGRPVAWNLVSGVNDPPARSERAIWVDGLPSEPGPVRFDDLDAVDFDDGSRLEFSAAAERRRAENLIVVRYSYRQPFGSFGGTLAGGLDLAEGLGVMEHHDARW